MTPTKRYLLLGYAGIPDWAMGFDNCATWIIVEEADTLHELVAVREDRYSHWKQTVVVEVIPVLEAYKLAAEEEASSKPRMLRHGVDCEKVRHLGGGYLHAAYDDSPYDVDGVPYCGRCHQWLEHKSRSAEEAALKAKE